ncbi:unnamed protein product [Scytosiphon promiscuus]
MASFETTAGPGAGLTWQPLGVTDYGAIGLTTVIDVAVTLLLTHVVWNGGWPPYTAAIPQVVIYASLAAILATLGVSIRYGMWGAAGEDVECDAVLCLTWLGLGALFSSAFLRVYRYHNVLVRQSGVMWPVAYQLVLLLLPFMLVPVFLAGPEMKSFDSTSMECEPSSQVPELVAFGVMGAMAVGVLRLTFRLRSVRVQAPYEYETSVATSATLAISTIVLTLVHATMDGDGDERMYRRAAMLTITALTGVGVVTTPVLRQLKGYIVDEAKLKTSGDFCVGEWRPKRKTKHMTMQFRRFQDVASSPQGREVPNFPVMAKFFRTLMAREESKSYPLLQVATMRILDTYFRPDAPGAIAVPMSEGCRTTTLQFRASSIYIFDRAREEMLEKMGVSKLLPASEDLPPVQDPIMGRGYSLATTGVGSSLTSSPAQIGTTPIQSSPTSRTAITVADMDAIMQPHELPPPIKGSPSFSHSPSTAESLQYSDDSPSPRSSAALSPLHPVSLSQQDSGSDNSKQHRSAVVSTTDNSPDTPLTSPLDYRGANRGSKKKIDKNQAEGDGSSGDAGAGVGSVEQRNRGRSAILSLFGRLGGGEKRRGSQRVQEGGSSAESSPAVVHMMGSESEGAAINEAAAAEQGMAGAAVTLGRTGERSSGVRKVAGVADVHAAFGLQRDKDDEDDGTSYYRSTGFLGGGGGARSTPDDSTDLAEAARAIPHPLFGDPNRGFAAVTSSKPMIVPGNSLDLANAYGLDVGTFGEQESPLPSYDDPGQPSFRRRLCGRGKGPSAGESVRRGSAGRSGERRIGHKQQQDRPPREESTRGKGKGS